jgi:RNA polymerase sigma-70 factor (ECF subfamily)
MTSLAEDPISTRYTLLSRLEDREDQDSWKDFFDTYWRLIYSVALKSGLTEAEAQDVVQETIISVARDIQKFKRDRTLGSFKGWLRNIIRWRIADQLRKRTTLSRPERTCRGRTWRKFLTRRAETRNPPGKKNGRPIC